MDANNISYGEGSSKIEFCDILDIKNKNLIHIKRFTGSHSMSHLFAQGAHSFTLLVKDAEFRKKVKNKIAVDYNNISIDLNEKYNVVYGIITNKKKVGLPFFSKLTLIEYVENIKKIRHDALIYVQFIMQSNKK